MSEDLIVGPAKYTGHSKVKFAAYGNGELAILLVHPETEERLAVATVNLETLGAKAVNSEFVWLKGWSENEGIPEALEKAGILKRTGEVFSTGLVYAEFARMLVEVSR